MGDTNSRSWGCPRELTELMELTVCIKRLSLIPWNRFMKLSCGLRWDIQCICFLNHPKDLNALEQFYNFHCRASDSINPFIPRGIIWVNALKPLGTFFGNFSGEKWCAGLVFIDFDVTSVTNFLLAEFFFRKYWIVLHNRTKSSRTVWRL